MTVAEATAEADRPAPQRPHWPRRLTKDQELQILRSLPRLQRLILISKVSAVVFFAIGLEGIVTPDHWMALGFIPIGVALAIWPIKMNFNICPRCGTRLPQNAAICTECGVAVL